MTSARERFFNIPELCDNVASTLQIKDRVACVQVCHHWNQLWVRHLYAFSGGPSHAPYFPQYGHHVRTLMWSKLFLPNQLDPVRIHCTNLNFINLTGVTLLWDDFWVHFLGLNSQTAPPALVGLSNDNDTQNIFKRGDVGSKDWDRELSSLSGDTNAFLAGSVKSLSLFTSFASHILMSLSIARVVGDNVLPKLSQFTITDITQDSMKPALRLRHIHYFLDAFPSLEQLSFGNFDFIGDLEDQQYNGIPYPSHAISQSTFNLSVLSLPHIDSTVAFCQVLKLVPQLEKLHLHQTWYTASVLQIVAQSCPDLQSLILQSRTRSSSSVPSSAFSLPLPSSSGSDVFDIDYANVFQKLKALRFIMTNITDEGLTFLLSGTKDSLALSPLILKECTYMYRRLTLEDRLYYGLSTFPEWRPSWKSIRYLLDNCSWLRILNIIDMAGQMVIPVNFFAPLNNNSYPPWACAESLEELLIKVVKLNSVEENKIMRRTLATLKNIKILETKGTGILPEALLGDLNDIHYERSLPLWPHLKELTVKFDSGQQMNEEQLRLLLDDMPNVTTLRIDSGVSSEASKWIQIHRPDIDYHAIRR
ncbi:hypothetical protein BGZ46_001540 [Entomortierella lignicola]|nr:hypothetical protein BGZ46_001540 [Entomortierella lignicola]